MQIKTTRHTDPAPSMTMTTKAIASLAIVLASLPTAALAQQQHQTFRDANGRTLGRSSSDPKGNTIYYDNMGRNTGRSVTHGNRTTVYDQMGRQTGNITTKPQGR
jgi:hypothetical protein